MDILEIVKLVGGLILLIFGGDYLVRGASNIAFAAKLSPLVVGLTIVSFGTSAPELVISIQSAFSGSADLAMGNVIGSNICNIALVLGITAVFSKIPVSENTIKIDWIMAMGSALLLYFFVSQDLSVDRFEGIIFVLILAIYTYFLIEMSRRENLEKLALERIENEDIPPIESINTYKEVGFFLLGCIMLYFGSDWFVGGAISIATFFEISPAVIGLTLVAVGTSLPELVASIIAARSGNTDMALGNILGSNIFNILSILGITSTIKKIEVSKEVIHVDMLWMLAITLITLPMMLTRKRLSKIEGFIFLFIYGFYLYNLYNRGIGV